MANRVLVDGPPFALDAVRRALPNLTVAALKNDLAAPDSAAPFGHADCVFMTHAKGPLSEAAKQLIGRVPLVVLLLESGTSLDDAENAVPTDWADPPRAHCTSADEIRLAARAAMTGFQVQRFSKELAGPWMHDARGALGVAQLALKIMGPSADSASPVQKLDNAVTRLGWLVERLPTQYTLCLELPEMGAPAPMVFPTLQTYVSHLRHVQPRRAIEFNEGEWSTRPSDQLVPYASGFADLAFSLSSARSKLTISISGPQSLAVESECPERRAPFDGCLSMTAADLERHGSAVPYRLLEVARLARRTGALLSLEFTAHGFHARAELPPLPKGHSQLT